MPLTTRVATQIEAYLGDKVITPTEYRLRRLDCIRHKIIDMAGDRTPVGYSKSRRSRRRIDSIRVSETGVMIVESQCYVPCDESEYVLLRLSDGSVVYERGNEDEPKPRELTVFDRDDTSHRDFLKKAVSIALNLAP